MSPIREHMQAAQQRLQEMEEHIQHDQHRLKHYQQELDTIYPPAYVYNRKKTGGKVCLLLLLGAGGISQRPH